MSTAVKKYLHDIDLQTNRLINARLHPLTTAQRIALGSSYNSGDIGVFVYDTDLKVFYVWDGNAWFAFSVSEALFIQIQEAYDKYTKKIEIISTETVHTVTLTSRDDSTLSDTIKYAHIHDQGTPSNQWTITHNLGKYPSVTIVDTANSEVIGEVDYLSNNQIKVSFSASFSGKAYLN
jgi:hypothetical protein